jgi:hypothetical protein
MRHSYDHHNIGNVQGHPSSFQRTQKGAAQTHPTCWLVSQHIDDVMIVCRTTASTLAPSATTSNTKLSRPLSILYPLQRSSVCSLGVSSLGDVSLAKKTPPVLVGAFQIIGCAFFAWCPFERYVRIDAAVFCNCCRAIVASCRPFHRI